jgi:hypothetical protein
MVARLQWYDSNWLEKYLQAKDVIAKVAPSKLTDFVDSFQVLRTDPNFSVIDAPGVFDAETLSEIKQTIRALQMNDMEVHELKSFGRFVVHDIPKFTELQSALVDKVSDMAGEPVEPRYNFLSLYTRMGVCEPHLDAPLAKWTLDVCIDQSEPWPIHFSQVVAWPEERPQLDDDWQASIKNASELDFQSKELAPGNGIIFSGSSQWHYRDALPAKDHKSFCNLLFFHYIPRGASEIVAPRNWATLFDIPELAGIPGINENS